MDEMSEKLGAILNNPQLMQQIMSLADTMGSTQPQSPGQPEQTTPSFPNIDLSALSKLSGVLGKSNISQEEKTLLHALTPYLSANRIHKLERAMRAAKMAQFASVFLNSGGIQLLTGR